MNSFTRTVAARARQVALGCAALCWIVLCDGAAAQTLVDISNAPLYGGRQAHPNVVVATSVEYTSTGAAYLNIPYVRTTSYLGYFDAAKCYTYTPVFTSPTFLSRVDTDGYFRVAANADANHECSSQFSGNFMNWVTMSAVDEFRYALTGGNRVDENGPANGTFLLRSYLPDGNVSGVDTAYRSYLFPPHRIGPGGVIDSVASSRPSAVLPYPDGTAYYINNCKTQVYIATFDGGNCNAPAANAGSGGGFLGIGANAYPGALNVRVLVCDNTEGPLRTDLCRQYNGPNGPYKPVGQVQINAPRMRFAAFGYLMDRAVPGYTPACDTLELGWNRCRYGGVLRAPMKYVGPKTYDAEQTETNNRRSEINNDGSLVDDPERTMPENAASAGGTYSGFINFINKFGSGGVYKRVDPAGELYYEALRYYQGLQPTPIAVAGITQAMKDSLPVTTTWTDPIQSTCSQNYIISLADAQTWDDVYLPGYTGSPSRPPGRPATRAPEGGLDAYLWASRIGDLESGTASITTNDVRPGLRNLQNQVTGAVGASYAVAGAAFWANTNDIRSDLPGRQTVRTISFDVGEPSVDIHDRQLYLMGKYGGFVNTIDRSSDTYPNPFWSDNPALPLGAAIRTNSEWEDSEGSAYPTNYVLSSDPQKLVSSIRSAFARISAQSGNLAGTALTSANLTYGAAGAYVATFDPAKWSGSVVFDSISVDTATGNLLVSGTPLWDAGALLSTRCGTVSAASTVCTDLDVSANKRNIVTTVRSTSSRVRSAVPFTYANILASDASYLAALSTNPATSLPDLLAPQRVNYLRGYRADEASVVGFRPRDSVMGDVINSGPVYVGPPTATIVDASYQPFFTANASRTPAVYVGANDGMLHAFRASDGFELFAYIPNYSSPDLADLTNPGYVHESFVDTLSKVQEVKIGADWKTVLVGANGNGAQGIFGLDVTDPAAFGPSKVLFEFSDSDDADFGNVTAAPEIAKLWVSGPVTAPVYRYFAVVTGYNNRNTVVNNTRPDTRVSTQTMNQGVLFLIALDHALGTNWQQNVDYYKVSLPASNPAQANGLGPVTLLASKTGDQSTASLYFGDLQGNLWKINTGTGNPATWAPAIGTFAAPQPIFVAKDAANNRQPITGRLEIANGPFGSNLLFFGTGKYLGASDILFPTAVQSEYALLDVNPSVVITRSSDLAPRTAATGTCPPGVTGPCLAVTGAAFSYSGPSAKKGWYLDFPNSVSAGERSITKPAVRTGLLTFTTLTLANSLCGTGSGYVYQVNALTGLAVGGAGATIGYVSTVGIPGPPRVVDLTVTPGPAHPSGETINRKTQTTLVSGTSGAVASFGGRDASGNNLSLKAPPTQQINWREITNWNDKVGK